jgi:N-acetylneuraminic acid mutarotase
MRIHRFLFALAVLASTGFCLSAWSRGPLTFEERVKAQEAIERVYYAHRIWPKENPTPKPPFDAMVPRAVIEAKVTDYLKKCAALDQFWHRPIQPEHLQAEMDRMAKGTKDPAKLQELFSALGSDPFLIAECLARQVLAERLLSDWFLSDSRFQAHAIESADRALAHLQGGELEGYPEGTFSRVIIRLRDENPGGEPAPPPSTDPMHREISLSQKEFEGLLSEHAVTGQLIRKEDMHSITIIRSKASSANSLDLALLSFPKQDYGDWWLRAQKDFQVLDFADSEDPHDEYRAPSLSRDTGSCQDQWLDTSLRLLPRAYHTVVWTGSEMIVWGGSSVSNVGSGTGSRFNPSTNTWLPVTHGSATPDTFQNHTAVWTGTEMIIWGGQIGSPVNIGGRYNPLTDSWVATSTTGNCPSARKSHTAVWTGSEMIIWGGYGTSFRNDGARYDPQTDLWTPISTGSPCPSARSRHCAVWTGTAMIVWGGAAASYTNTGGIYTPASNTWTATSTASPCPAGRLFFTAVWSGTEMIIWGGSNGTYLSTGGRYNPSTDVWVATSTGANCPSARQDHTAVWAGTKMVIWGGYNGSVLSSCGRFTPSTDSWALTYTDANTASAREHHTAIWTGTEMIVWGGTANDAIAEYGLLNTGARYNPVTNVWTPVTACHHVPSPRTGNTAIWTGSEMIVWGGYLSASNAYYNDGSRYSPAMDTWNLMTALTNRPGARHNHTAVWSGTEMIIWGGSTSGGDTQTGGRYNPTTETWTATSTSGSCPAARYSHRSVWTGIKMIIWGGGSALSPRYHNDGGLYDPSGNTWSATSVGDGCPSQRVANSAVWTGTEMIIWGGYFYDTSTHYYNTGGRYNPESNAWTATPTDGNCPFARHCHASLWTGDEMIIWGGSAPGHPDSNGGARYDPQTETWSAMSTSSGCPTGADYASAVWTGYEAIIWGGGNSGTFLDTGGRYYPPEDSWAATSRDANCAVERSGHKAFWTGSLMLVWGGDYGTLVGGAYRPGPTIHGTSPCVGSAANLSTGYFSSYQWLRDGDDIPGATSRTLTVSGAESYSVRITFSDGTPCTSEGYTVLYTQPSPSVTGATRNACGTLTVPLSTQTYAAYQWIQDGADVPGATGQGFTASANGMYAVRVTDAKGCQNTSSGWSITIQDCTDEVSSQGAFPPMRLVPDAASSTGYYLQFQKIPYATGYSCYEGTLASLALGSYDHGAGSHCDLSFTDLGTGEMRAEIAPSAGDHYHLVTAHSATLEGPSGFTSSNQEIDPAQSTCPP